MDFCAVLLEIHVPVGEFMEKSLRYMEAAIAIGAMDVKFSGEMNLINAPMLAKEAGVQVTIAH